MLPPNEEERICAALWAQAVYEMSGHAVLPANAVALARERGFYHIFRGGDTIYIQGWRELPASEIEATWGEATRGDVKALLPKTMCLSTPRGNRWRGVDTPKPEAIDPKSDAGLRAALRALREEKAAARVAVREKQ